MINSSVVINLELPDTGVNPLEWELLWLATMLQSLGFELLRQLCILSNHSNNSNKEIESGVLSRWIDIRDRCMCWYVCQIELIRSYTLLRRWIPLIRLLSLLGQRV